MLKWLKLLAGCPSLPAEQRGLVEGKGTQTASAHTCTLPQAMVMRRLCPPSFPKQLGLLCFKGIRCAGGDLLRNLLLLSGDIRGSFYKYLHVDCPLACGIWRCKKERQQREHMQIKGLSCRKKLFSVPMVRFLSLVLLPQQHRLSCSARTGPSLSI